MPSVTILELYLAGTRTVRSAITDPLPGDRKLTVTAGHVMTIDTYLVTRLVEQGVHLDDLARSVGREPGDLPLEAHRLVARIGVDIAFLRRAPHKVVRALYRRGQADTVLPVI
jgi:hypothetical protein